MAPGRARDERKAQQWRRWIGEWLAIWLSVRAFCKRRGLALASLYAWRRILEPRAAEKAALVPVQIVADATPASASSVEVVPVDGLPARVAPGLDAVILRLSGVLQEGGPCRTSRRPWAARRTRHRRARPGTPR
jgi:hypothetical protein